MRAVGYSVPSAVADLVDNSITAGADKVDVRFATDDDEFLLILDNGQGMDLDEAVEAMRLGSRSPLRERDARDLGRFGLGLKTASLAQCRELTVVTKKNDVTSALRWSLDHVLETGRWSLLRLSEADTSDLPGAADLRNQVSGTLVLWRDLDRLSAGTPSDRAREFDRLMASARDHLALVFHRFLDPSEGPGLRLTVNGIPVPVIDPFLASHRATLLAPPERLSVAGTQITVQAFTLPFVNKLSAADRQKAQISGHLRDNQGFYIYRARRLVIWGTWFGIVPKDDLGKLARVRVDVPNSMDHLWALDIKKSAAEPPPEIRRALRRVAQEMVQPSRKAHRYRGREASDPAVRTWKVIEEREGFRYEINRDHPAVSAVSPEPDAAALESLLRLVESTYPLGDAYNRLSADQPEQRPASFDSDAMGLARQLWANFAARNNNDVDRFVQSFSLIEPFVLLTNPAAFLTKAATT